MTSYLFGSSLSNRIQIRNMKPNKRRKKKKTLNGFQSKNRKAEVVFTASFSIARDFVLICTDPFFAPHKANTGICFRAYRRLM